MIYTPQRQTKLILAQEGKHQGFFHGFSPLTPG